MDNRMVNRSYINYFEEDTSQIYWDGEDMTINKDMNQQEDLAKVNIEEESLKPIEYTKDREEEYIIPMADLEQWSNITIMKKSKKKIYKFWQTPIDGKDIFGIKSTEVKDKIDEYSIPPEVEAFLKKSEMYNQEDSIIKTELIEVSQN